MFKRQRGESLKAYLERIDVESNARIMEAYRRSRKQSDRRKRYVLILQSSPYNIAFMSALLNGPKSNATSCLAVPGIMRRDGGD